MTWIIASVPLVLGSFLWLAANLLGRAASNEWQRTQAGLVGLAALVCFVIALGAAISIVVGRDDCVRLAERAQGVKP